MYALNLFSSWARGDTILAGTGALMPAPQARVTRECPDCPTWLIGAGQIEVAERMAEHRRQWHG